MDKAQRRIIAYYAVMFVGAGCALWTILKIGSHLVPPADLHGDWALEAPQRVDLPQVMAVQQSGIFVTVRLGDKATFSGKLQPQASGALGGTLRSHDGKSSLNLVSPEKGKLLCTWSQDAPTTFTAHKPDADNPASARPAPEQSGAH